MIRKLYSTDTSDKIYAFLTRPAYLWALAALTAVSFALQLEPVLYTVFALIAAFTAFCAPDILPVLPLLAFGYVATSTENNPGQNANSVFSGVTGIYIICLGVIIVGSLMYRVIRDRKQLFRKNGMLLKGLIFLTVAYVLSGIGFPGYWYLAWKNIPYALVQGLALLLPYWLMVGGVDWQRHRKDLFAWMGFALGCLLVFEILWIYISQGVLESGMIIRTRIYTGWGMYNNVGNLIATMIPFAFWIATHYKRPRIGYGVGAVFLIGVFMTCSRSSMIFGTICYAVCCLVLPDGRSTAVKSCVLLGVAALGGLVLIVFHEQIFRLYIQILDDASELHSRFDIYGQGLGEFVKNPIFGGSFYPSKGLSYSWAETGITSFLPARWHNTVIQLLASTGLVGLGAYGYHRYQTFRLALHRKDRLNMLTWLSALVIILGSLVDCHMFNVGPGMFYAMLLAWVEKKEI